MTTTTADRARIWLTAYDLRFWLEWYGSPGEQTRQMGHELTSNLHEGATEPGGSRAAVRRLGSLRHYARDAVGERPGFLWRRGLMVAVLVFALFVMVQLALALTYADGLLAAGGGSGRLMGGQVAAGESDEVLTVTFAWAAWVPLLSAAAAFVLVSRPWRALDRREHADH